MGKRKDEGRKAAKARGADALIPVLSAEDDRAQPDLVLLPAGPVLNPLSDSLIRLFSLRTILTRPTWLAGSDWLDHVPFAFWLIEAVKPRLLVELGSGAGVSYFAFCQAAERLGLDIRAFGVDDWAGRDEGALRDRLQDHNQSLYSAFSRLVDSPPDAAIDLFDDVAGLGGVDLLHLDGESSHDSVQARLAAWMPRLSDQAVVVLHRSNERAAGAGVMRLVADLRSRFPVFEFTHGQGLAVIGVGPRQVPAMARLFALDQDQAARQALHAMFGRLGQACADAQDLRQARAAQRAAEAALAAHTPPARAPATAPAPDSPGTLALIAQLTAERDEARARAEAAAQPVPQDTPATASLADQVQDLRQSLSERTSEVAALTAMVLDHQRLLREAEAARDALRLDYQQLQQQNQPQPPPDPEPGMLEAELVAQRSRFEELDGALQAAQARIMALTGEAAVWQARHDAVLNSASWRLSAPIRAMSRAVRRRPPG
jgi:hypothetical protein